MKQKNKYPKIMHRIKSENASVFLEYSMLFAFFAVVICLPLMPGGFAYDFLHNELRLKIILISYPFF